MTSSERQRRIEAAARELCAIENEEEQRHYESDPAAFRLGRPKPDPFENWAEEYVGKATRMLDAADEAVPMVAKIEAERAKAVASDFAEALRGVISPTGSRYGRTTFLAIDALLAKYPSFSGEEGTE